MSTLSEDLNCVICCENYENENSVLIVPCQHKYCKFCILEMAFVEEKPLIKCPLDFLENRILEYFEKLPNQEVHIVKQHVSDYRIQLIPDVLDDLWPEFEKYCLSLITFSMKDIDIMNKIGAIFTEFLQNCSHIIVEHSESYDPTDNNRQVEILENEMNIKVNGFNNEDVDPCIKIKILFNSLKHIPKDKLNLKTRIKILNYKLTIQYLNSLKDLDHSIQYSKESIYDSQFVDKFVDVMYATILWRMNISQGIMSIAISHHINNTELYKGVYPDISPTEIGKCLICTDNIEEKRFAKFAACNHKICIICVDNFMITQGFCPFDKSEDGCMKLSTSDTDLSGSVFQYLLKSRWENMTTKLNHFSEFLAESLFETHKIVKDIFQQIICFHETIERNSLAITEESDKRFRIKFLSLMDKIGFLIFSDKMKYKFRCYVTCYRLMANQCRLTLGSDERFEKFANDMDEMVKKKLYLIRKMYKSIRELLKKVWDLYFDSQSEISVSYAIILDGFFKVREVFGDFSELEELNYTTNPNLYNKSIKELGNLFDRFHDSVVQMKMDSTHP